MFDYLNIIILTHKDNSKWVMWSFSTHPLLYPQPETYTIFQNVYSNHERKYKSISHIRVGR